MNYWFWTTDKRGLVYSCDMVRYKLSLKNENYNRNGLNFLQSINRADITVHRTNFKDYKYRNMFNIVYGKSSMTVGIGLNTSNSLDLLTGFFEVNPNKCFSNPQCLRDLYNLSSASWKVELVRFDLAIDIPLPRASLSIAKDGRHYAMDMYSIDNKTEYLGSRNQGGFVKLYNKGIEQKNEKLILSRLELTCAGDWNSADIVRKLPYVNTTIFDLDNGASADLNSTQAALVRALRTSSEKDEIYKSLHSVLRVKLRPYLYDTKATLTYDEDCILQVLQALRQFEKDMDEGMLWFRAKELEGQVNPFEVRAAER